MNHFFKYSVNRRSRDGQFRFCHSHEYYGMSSKVIARRLKDVACFWGPSAPTLLSTSPSDTLLVFCSVKVTNSVS